MEQRTNSSEKERIKKNLEAKEASKGGEDWNRVLRHHQVEGGQATADQRQGRSEDQVGVFQSKFKTVLVQHLIKILHKQ